MGKNYLTTLRARILCTARREPTGFVREPCKNSIYIEREFYILIYIYIYISSESGCFLT